MDKGEFDRYAQTYRSLHAANIAVSGESPDYFAEYKIKDLVSEYGLIAGRSSTPKVLDFGAGVGSSVPFFGKHLPAAQLTCLDVSAQSLKVSQGRFPGQADYVHFDGAHIPFPDGRFDIALAACVFHHIQHEMHFDELRELHRVVAPGGMLILFEHNPYNPLTVRAVNSCPFDADARLISAAALRKSIRLAGFEQARIRYRIFFPNLLRALRPLERFMTWLPLGAQYYVVARK